MVKKNKFPLDHKDVIRAHEVLKGVVERTPLLFSNRLSKKYQAKIYLKREDLQPVRSYKIRGAYNAIHALRPEQKKKGIVCASAGNHAQGVAFSANTLNIQATIVMPQNTPRQKVTRVGIVGGKKVKIILFGDTYDASYEKALTLSKEKGYTLIHPFDNPMIIAGQGTVAKEIIEDLPETDIVMVPIGGGGLISGMSIYLKGINHKAKIIGAEPKGAPSMYNSVKKGHIVTLESIDKFVDGAAVKTPGKNTYNIVSKLVDDILLVPEGRICEEMIYLYQNRGIVTEPAGALGLSALRDIKKKIKGKNVVCILSGGNNDITRYSEIMERSLIYQGLKHYFMIYFFQRQGSLKQFMNTVIDDTTDITFFEYIKRSNKESAPALVGIELARKEDLNKLMVRMKKMKVAFEKIEPEHFLFKFLI